MRNIFSRVSGLLSDDLLRHTSILFSGMMVVNVCNVIYQMAVSRVLPSEEYALLAAFLGVLVIISRPLTTLTTGISHYSSLLCQDGRVGDVRRLLRKWLLLTGVPAIALGAVAVVFNRTLAGYLHLDRVAPVVIAGALLPALFWLPVLSGAGQGLQRFWWCSASTVAGALVRLGLGAGLVWFVYPACGWAMLGHGAGIYASVVVLGLGLFLLLRGQKKSDISLPSMRFYLLQSFFIQASFAILMTADVVLVKHYFPNDTEFAYAATLGRLVAFLPGSIATAMFPKVSSKGMVSAIQWAVFRRSFRYTVLVVVVAVAGCSLFPDLMVRVLFGISDPSAGLAGMIRLMSIVMAISALLNIAVQFMVAQRQFKLALPVTICAMSYLALAALFHSFAWQIVFAAAACNLAALLILLVFFFWNKDSRLTGNEGKEV